MIPMGSARCVEFDRRGGCKVHARHAGLMLRWWQDTLSSYRPSACKYASRLSPPAMRRDINIKDLLEHESPSRPQCPSSP
jgi:hypothetical protein